MSAGHVNVTPIRRYADSLRLTHITRWSNRYHISCLYYTADRTKALQCTEMQLTLLAAANELGPRIVDACCLEILYTTHNRKTVILRRLSLNILLWDRFVIISYYSWVPFHFFVNTMKLPTNASWCQRNHLSHYNSASFKVKKVKK